MSTPANTDIFLVQRGTTQYRVAFDKLNTVADTDLLLVQRGTTQHKVAGVDLKAYLAGTEPPPDNLWTPADTDTLLWLDAADALTITVVDGFATEWRDKSGLGRHATQAEASRQVVQTPRGLNGLDCLTAPSMGRIMTSPAAAGSFPDAFSAFYVFRFNHGNSGPVMRSSWHLGRPLDRGLNQIVNWGAIGTPTFDLNEALSPVVTFTMMRRWGEFTRADDFLNGVQTGFRDTFPAWADEANTIQVFAREDVGTSFAGDIGEVVVFGVGVGGNDQAVVEGYLAHKWGTADSLPAEHPYKDAPPTK